MQPPSSRMWVLKVPPPVWTLAMLAIAYALRAFSSWGAIFVLRLKPLAYMVGAVGIVIAAWAVMIFAVSGTEIEPASHSNKLLVTRSPFNFTRNPMYLGLILIALACAFYWGAWPFFVVPVLVFLLCDRIFIPFEEEKMRRQFGDRYTEYCARVRRWL